jgi:hypothetical protein
MQQVHEPVQELLRILLLVVVEGGDEASHGKH